MSTNLREELRDLAERLPENATWKDVLYEAYVRQEIEKGLREARHGEFAGDTEVKSAFARWGYKLKLKWTREALRQLTHGQKNGSVPILGRLFMLSNELYVSYRERVPTPFTASCDCLIDECTKTSRSGLIRDCLGPKSRCYLL